MTTKPDSELKEIADAIVSFVKFTEGKPPVTRGHYGEYMSLLSAVSNGDVRVARNLAMTLKDAGANRQGVDDALKIVVGG